MDEELKPYQQYIYEKLLSDMFGCTSVTNFEEWLEIKNKPMTETWKVALLMQYLDEMEILERRGHHSVVTFDEWLEMKQNNYEWIRKELMKNKK